MNEALKIEDDNLFPEEHIIEGININELKEMNRNIISEANRLAENVTSFLKKKLKTDITKEDQKEFEEKQKEGWKQVREMERAYAFLLKKAKQKGIKQKDIESDDDASPDIESIKKQKGTIGAIVRKME